MSNLLNAIYLIKTGARLCIVALTGGVQVANGGEDGRQWDGPQLALEHAHLSEKQNCKDEEELMPEHLRRREEM